MAEPSALIDEFLPTYDAAERHHVDVRAPEARVYAALQAADLCASRRVRLLLWLRGLPGRRGRARRGGGPRTLTLGALLAEGFVLLGERPSREVALGLVGRFWATAGELQRLDADGFRRFARPGYAQAVWSFSLSERGGGVVWLTTETRVRCLDAGSRARFRRYWRLVGPFSGAIRRAMLDAIRREAERPGGRADGARRDAR